MSRRVDTAVAVWVVLWLLLGLWTGMEVWRLSDLTVTVEDSGYAIDNAGRALVSLDAVPVVGDRSAEIGMQVRENAADIVGDAQRARDSFRRLAVLLGVVVALVPSVPIVLLRVVVRRTILRAA
ncbi:MAG: hypothetical protein ACLGIG_02100 [Actinomycetes bacterium]